jgi:hypothetical protein
MKYRKFGSKSVAKILENNRLIIPSGFIKADAVKYFTHLPESNRNPELHMHIPVDSDIEAFGIQLVHFDSFIQLEHISGQGLQKLNDAYCPKGHCSHTVLLSIDTKA